MLRGVGDASSAGWRAEGAGTDGWTLRAASVVGVRHRLAGQPSDDSYAWAHEAGTVVAAVSDGIGTVPGSAAAAERACRAAVSVGLSSGGPPEEAARRAFSAANEAAEGGGAATLVVAVLAGGGTAAVARFGDSTAFLIGRNGTCDELFDPPDPDRAGTATPALPARGAYPEVRSVRLDTGSALVLATDGVADPWRDGPTTVAPAMIEALLEPPEPVQLLALTDFSRQGCHDDRTVVCLWPNPRGD